MMRRWFTVVLIAILTGQVGAADDPVTWVVEYDGTRVPAGPAWSACGAPTATVMPEGLHLRDESDAKEGGYRAAWAANPNLEVVVEATLKLGKTTGALKSKPTSVMVCPWRDGVPVGLLVSDGRHQDGLMFRADRVTTFTDRFVPTDTTTGFHTYRLVIRGMDMSVVVDG